LTTPCFLVHGLILSAAVHTGSLLCCKPLRGLPSPLLALFLRLFFCPCFQPASPRNACSQEFSQECLYSSQCRSFDLHRQFPDTVQHFFTFDRQIIDMLVPTTLLTSQKTTNSRLEISQWAFGRPPKFPMGFFWVGNSPLGFWEGGVSFFFVCFFFFKGLSSWFRGRQIHDQVSWEYGKATRHGGAAAAAAPLRYVGSNNFAYLPKNHKLVPSQVPSGLLLGWKFPMGFWEAPKISLRLEISQWVFGRPPKIPMGFFGLPKSQWASLRLEISHWVFGRGAFPSFLFAFFFSRVCLRGLEGVRSMTS